MRGSVKRAGPIAAVLWALANTAQAVPIVNGGPDGLAAPDVVIDFGAGVLPLFATVTDQFALQGVLLDEIATAANLIYLNQTIQRDNLIDGVVVVFPTNLASVASIGFLDPVSAAGFHLQTFQATTTFTALMDGVVVDTFKAATMRSNDPTPNNFFGFEGIVFDEIRFSVVSFSNAFVFDNLQYSLAAQVAVSEPAGAGLSFAALLALGLLSGRRRR